MALVPNLNNIFFVIEKTLLLSTQTGGAVSGARVWGACISMFATLNKAQDRVGPPPLSVKVPALSAIYSYSYDYSTLDYGGRVVQIDKQAVKDPMGIIW